VPSEHDGRWGREIREAEAKERDARVHPIDDARGATLRSDVSNAVGRWANAHPDINKRLRFDMVDELVDSILSALPQLSSSERRCGDCGHADAIDPHGRCMSVYYDAGGSLVYCGHKCVFPATGTGEGEQRHSGEK
jgi:hypothetical protein